MNISEMTNEQLNDACAIEVMGWEMVQMTPTSKECWGECHTDPWIGIVGHEIIEIAKWNPTHDLNQVWMLVNKLIDTRDFIFDLRAVQDGAGRFYEVNITDRENKIYSTTKYSRVARAISEACLMAKRSIPSAI